MKRIALALLIASAPAMAQTMVDGYVRKDGTYVAPHIRSEPNQQRFDNYNAQGNVNPYSGQRGHQPHEFSNPPVRQAPVYPNPYQQQRRGY
jgi:hypothetical protein